MALPLARVKRKPRSAAVCNRVTESSEARYDFSAQPWSPMNRHVVLLVEPDWRLAERIAESIEAVAQVDHYAEFKSARRRLGSQRFDFVVANLRLGPFNGLHLAYAVNALRPTRCIVYTESREPALAQDVRRAGAFYEVADRLPVTLPSYFEAELPPADRRDPAVPDRRTPFRGGRRIWDRQTSDHSIGL
jgi:hypothetical protein